jgi:hypothetical protein
VRYSVRQFKSMKLALKDLEPFVKNGALLQTGRPLKQFGGMLPREVLANWLLCATVNAVEGRRLVFSSDPTGGDGIIRGEGTCELFPIEHTMVSTFNLREGADAQTLILEAIEQKRTKGGAAYASGKTLVVFLDADAGVWFPNRVAKELPNPLHFATVWVVGLQERTDDGEYIYVVTHLDVSKGNAPAFRVRIAKDFDVWDVEDVQ